MPGFLRVKKITGIGHSGGRTQVNLNVLANRGIFHFVDMAKSGGMITDSTGGVVSPAIIDANGYPTSGTWSKSVQYPRPEEKTGDYYMIWLGGGPNTVMRSPGGTFVSSNLPGAGLTGANGIYRFTPSAGGDVNSLCSSTIGVQTTGASYSPVTMVAVVNVNDYAAWLDDPDAITPELIAAFAAGRFGVVRFLNWHGSAFQGANASNWTDWASRKPVGYHSYEGSEYRPTWWAGNPSNGGSGNDYTLSTPSAPTYAFGTGAPVDKQIMHVRFDQDATYINSTTVTLTGNTVNWAGHTFTGNEPVALYKISANLPSNLFHTENYYVVPSSVVAGVSFQISLTPGGDAISSFGSGASGNYGCVRLCTLNINETGAVPIRIAYGDQPSSGDMPKNNTGGGSPQPIYGTLVYDDDLKSWCMNGGTSVGSRGINNGTPPETMLRVAIRLRAHPWWVSSPFALDPMTDYWPTFAAYVDTNKPSWMIPRYEPVNEQWNIAAGFWGTRYGWGKSWHHWRIGFGTQAWQGKIASTMGQAIRNACGGMSMSKYWFVNGCQAASSWYSSGLTVTQNNERMSSSNYVNQAAAAQSGYTKEAAYKFTTHTSFANYTTGKNDQTLEELQYAILYCATHSTSPSSQATDLNNFTASGMIGPYVTGSSIFTIASPGVVNWPAHGRANNSQITIYSQGTLPTGLRKRITYWVRVIDANNFNLSASSSGGLINFTGSQSGNHTVIEAPVFNFTNAVVASQAQAFCDWGATYTNDLGNPIGVCPYEGLWSPSPSASDATATVSAATKETNCKVTVGANTVIHSGATVSGVAAQVGGAVHFGSIGGMTELNTATFIPTFAGGGSANISGANSLILNQGISFIQTSGPNFRLPPEIKQGTPYYVVSTGNPFQISETRGGPPITFAGTSASFGIVATPCWFVTAVNGQVLTLDVDSSAFSTYTSGGTMTYTNSGRQVTNLRMAARLATNMEGYTYGDTWPVPSLFASMEEAGVVFPSKFDLTGTVEPWASLMDPNAYLPYPTTGEWIGIKNYSN